MINVRDVLSDFISLAEAEILRLRTARQFDTVSQWEATVKQARELLAGHEDIDVEDFLA